ncbi:hypothetical protein GH733_002565 [Mirounga leonina]|nr:hypothetical protein GH733_002565 [Mirounga leonina]
MEEVALHARQPWGAEDPTWGAQASMGSHSKAESEAGLADKAISTLPGTSSKPWQGPMPAPEVLVEGPSVNCPGEDDQNVPSDKTQDRKEPQILAGDGEGGQSLIVWTANPQEPRQLLLDLETAFCSMFKLEALFSLVQKKTELPVTDHVLSPVICPARRSSPCRNMKKTFCWPFLLHHPLYPQ